MKRKIMMLLTLYYVPTLALNETSCFLFNRKNETTEAVDISDKKFDNCKISIINTPSLLHNEVKTQIGGWADPEISAADVSDDSNNIIVTIEDSSGDNIDSSTVLVSGTYTVKITVNEGDEYFKAQEEIEYLINVIPEGDKIDISNNLFNDVLLSDVSTGDLLYNEVRTQIGIWAGPWIYNNDINDTTTIITVQNSSGADIDDDNSVSISSGTYTVKIKVNSNDEYFETQDEIAYDINIVSERTKYYFDGSTPILNWNLEDVPTGKLLYYEVRKEIGSLAIPPINPYVFKNELGNDLFIAFANTAGDVLDNDDLIGADSYEVYFVINNDSGKYFDGFSTLLYWFIDIT